MSENTQKGDLQCGRGGCGLLRVAMRPVGTRLKLRRMKAKKRGKRKAVRTLVIDRRKWLRGGDLDGLTSVLLRPSDGKMCCMGIYGRALGVPRKKLLNIGLPTSADETLDLDDDDPSTAAAQWPAWLFRPIDSSSRM